MYKPQARIQSPSGLELGWLGDTPGAGPWLLGCVWQVDEESDAEGAPVSCPWFYPVVEQHDVTYHRVKPLAGHREKDTQGGSHTRSHQAELGKEVTTGKEQSIHRASAEGNTTSKQSTRSESTQHQARRQPTP